MERPDQPRVPRWPRSRDLTYSVARGAARVRSLVPWLVAAAVVSAGSCVSPSRGPAGGRSDFSPKLNPFVYYEDGRVLFIAVDGRAAQYVKSKERVFPLGLALANQAQSPLTFTRESFVIEAETGRQYPVISHQEYLSSYSNSRRDLRLADSFQSILFTRFGNAYRPVAWPLFPARGARTAVQERLELGRRHVTWGYLYFPVPPEGIHGKRFTLLVRPEDFPETFVVRFAVR